MLPKELLDVRRYRGKLFPRFAGVDDYDLAERVIKTFKAARGKKYGMVLKALRLLENAKNFRKVRGFARVLENYCVEKACAFGVDSELDPVEVRMFLFERGFVTSKKERDSVLKYAAKYFNTDVETIERAMYADREEELVVTRVDEITPATLIRLYNLSLLQTTVFSCLRLTFWTSSNHKEVFRAIKRLGLMYELYEDAGRMLVEVTGAASVLKMTRKYGTSMAKIIPYIIKAKNWWIKAEILENDRIYLMEIDDRHRDLFPEKEERIEYDSSLEEEFARKLTALGYEVVREPGVVKAGRFAFIPDFLVRKGKGEVYVEIVGFWTPEYIERKLEKVRLTDIPLVVVAREEFGRAEGVVTFSKRIPYNEVLREIRKRLPKESFEGEVVRIDGIGDLPPDYVKIGGYAIKKSVFERLKAEFQRQDPKTVEEARKILAKYGLGDSVLPSLGYQIVWKGLDRPELRKL